MWFSFPGCAAERSTPPGRSGLVERQVVAVAEVRILVTDRQGRAITDLRPEEIRIYDNFSRGTRENIADALGDPRVNVFPLGGDILHRDILRAAMEGIDGVFHFAALWLLHCHSFPRSAFEVTSASALV